MNSASGCAGNECGLWYCTMHWLCILLFVKFCYFPAFYLGYSTMRRITAGFCEEQTAIDNEIMNSMINEEEHVFEKFARGQEGVTGCRSVS